MSTNVQSNPPARFTAQQEPKLILRLLTEDSLEFISRECFVRATTLFQWHETSLLARSTWQAQTKMSPRRAYS